MGKPIQRKQGNPQPKRSPKIKNKTVPLKAKSKDKVELTAAKTKAKNSVKSSLSKGRAKRDASDVVIHKSLPKGTSENGKGMKPQKGVRKGKTKGKLILTWTGLSAIWSYLFKPSIRFSFR